MIDLEKIIKEEIIKAFSEYSELELALHIHKQKQLLLMCVDCYNPILENSHISDIDKELLLRALAQLSLQLSKLGLTYKITF